MEKCVCVCVCLVWFRYIKFLVRWSGILTERKFDVIKTAGGSEIERVIRWKVVVIDLRLARKRCVLQNFPRTQIVANETLYQKVSIDVLAKVNGLRENRL